MSCLLQSRVAPCSRGVRCDTSQKQRVFCAAEFFTPSQLGMALTAFHRAGVRPSPDTMAALERGWEMIWSSASREARVQIADALAAMR